MGTGADEEGKRRSPLVLVQGAGGTPTFKLRKS